MVRRLRLSVVCVFVCAATLAVGSGAALADPPGEDPGGRPPHGHEESGGFEVGDDLILQNALISDEQEAPLQTAPQCPVPARLTTPPSNPNHATRVVFVYVTPTASDSSWGDSFLDVPRLCSDGTVYNSPIDRMYRNTARFTARELSLDTSIGARRLKVLAQTYTWSNGVQTFSRSVYAAFLLRTTNTLQYWNEKTPSEKLSTLRTKLLAAGFDDPDTVYVSILHARQTTDDSSTIYDDRGVLGLGYTGGWDVTYQGKAWGAFAYVLRIGWNRGKAGLPEYSAVRFGCTEFGDTAVLHEASHVLGAVPESTGNGAGHMTGDGDLMSVSPARNFKSYVDAGGNTVPHLVLDRGADDYRTMSHLTPGYATTATAFQSEAYQTCPQPPE